LRWTEANGDSWRMRQGRAMPDYSLEQYDPAFSSGRLFYEAVQRRLGTGSKPIEVFSGLLEEVKKNIRDRVQIVEDGYVACQVENCAPGTIGWENWSTPSRDGRIVDRLNTLQSIRRSFPYDNDLYDLWDQTLNEFSVEVRGEILTFADLLELFEN